MAPMDMGTPTAGEGLGLMKQSIQLGARTILALAAVVLLLSTSVRVADAQDVDTDQLTGHDTDALVAQTERLVQALVTADLDENGSADFDASNDGVAELPLSNFADLQALPGSGDFADLVRSTFELGVSPAGTGVSLSPNCSAMVLSFDADGNLIDWALGAGADQDGDSNGILIDLFPQSETGVGVFTQDNPFIVGDRVVLIGDIATGIGGPSDHAAAWSTSSAGVPLGNGGTQTLATDGVAVDEFRIADHALGGIVEPVGVYPLDASIEIADLLCEVSGLVRFEQGSPLLTNVGLTASGFSVLGALGLFLNARPARAWKTDEKD